MGNLPEIPTEKATKGEQACVVCNTVATIVDGDGVPLCDGCNEDMMDKAIEAGLIGEHGPEDIALSDLPPTGGNVSQEAQDEQHD